MDKKIRILLFWKFMVLLFLIIFLIVFVTVPKTNCQTCNFELEGKSVSTEKFISSYYEKCIDKNPTLYSQFNFTVGNMTIRQE